VPGNDDDDDDDVKKLFKALPDDAL